MPLTVGDLVSQGYTRAHAEQFVADRQQAVRDLARAIAAQAGGRVIEEPPASPPAASVIRAWAREQGIDCPATGRIPGVVVTAYSKAHP